MANGRTVRSIFLMSTVSSPQSRSSLIIFPFSEWEYPNWSGRRPHANGRPLYHDGHERRNRSDDEIYRRQGQNNGGGFPQRTDISDLVEDPISADRRKLVEKR